MRSISIKFNKETLNLDIPKTVYRPREDSYLMADAMLELNLKGKSVLDIGTGSGYLAIIAANRVREIIGVDLNPRAVSVARKNAIKNNRENIDFKKSDLFSCLAKKFDLILFNPPYLPDEEQPNQSDLKQKAWNGGKNGRKVIDRFFDNFSDHLTGLGNLYLLQSSLSDTERTKKHLKAKNFDPQIVRDRKVSWERLVVIKA